MSLIEWVAAAFGLVAVWLTTRQSVWCWPTGLVQVGLYVFVFYEAKLYSDAILHVIYVGLQFYGWYHWLYGGRGNSPPPVTHIRPPSALAWIVAASLGTAVVGATMAAYTDAAFPVWDAAIMVWSLVAQYLMTRKILENWLVWIAVDMVAVGVYANKELYPTAGLYAVFLVLCVIGLFKWTRSVRDPRPA